MFEIKSHDADLSVESIQNTVHDAVYSQIHNKVKDGKKIRIARASGKAGPRTQINQEHLRETVVGQLIGHRVPSRVDDGARGARQMRDVA